MQSLQEPNQNNVDNLNIVGLETSRHFRNKKKEYRKAKIDDMKLTIRQTCVGVSVTVRIVISLELI
jgi:hypothetical protein